VSESDFTYNYFNYYTEIEEHFQRARGTGIFRLSPLDWALVESWKFAEVPLEAVLRGIGLSALVKTSGKTGLHVIVPIKRTLRYAAVREMAGYVGERLRQAHPRDITLDWQVTRRTGKVFIDANMNVRGKSISIAYSPRGLPGAPVSTPLTWKELRRIDPRALRVPTIPARIRKRGNPWNGWLGSAQSIEDALARDAATRKRRTEVHR